MYIRVTDTDSFINKAILLHGDKYDYSLANYEKAKTKVKIICKKHGIFEQRPSMHMKGQGCPKCFSLKGNKNQFIKKAVKIHGNKYNYSLVEYKDSRTKVTIICPIHKEFNQRPSSHINGQGCPRCTDRGKMTTEDFIKKANEVHGNKYDYSKTDYKGSFLKVQIKCITHGYFNQQTSNHLSGKGCPKCAHQLTSRHQKENPTAWSTTNWEKASLKSKHFDSFKVYVIKCWNDNETFYKIGRTFKTVKGRFPGKDSMPYNYEIVKEIILNNARDCFNKESELKRLNKENKYIPLIHFGGMHECFSNIL